MSAQVTRTCVACRTRADRGSLLRIAAAGRTFIVDPACVAGGRGVYVCKRRRCVEEASSRRLLERGLKANIQPAMAEALREQALRYVVVANGD